MACSHCSFCGINLSNGLKRRLYSPVPGRKFILQRCKATPFLYPLLTAGAIDPDRKQHLCIPCVNWKRRAEHGRLKRTRLPMLQLDQMILFLLQPGRFQEPDHRCMERLVVAVRQPDNMFRSIFPAPVQRITRDIAGDTYQHCVAAWWLYNGRTEFFFSPQEAKRVRSAVKAGLVSEEGLDDMPNANGLVSEEGLDDTPNTNGLDDIPNTSGLDDMPNTSGLDDMPNTSGLVSEEGNTSGLDSERGLAPV